MSALRDRHTDRPELRSGPSAARPVLLATMAARIEPSAERVAIDNAVEAGVPLLVVNLVPLPFYPRTMVLLGPAGTTLPHEEALDDVRDTARRAAALGVRTELRRVRTRHPAAALMEVARERDAGLLVFGPQLGPLGRLRFRAAARKVRREADCLVWIA